MTRMSINGRGQRSIDQTDFNGLIFSMSNSYKDKGKQMFWKQSDEKIHRRAMHLYQHGYPMEEEHAEIELTPSVEQVAVFVTVQALGSDFDDQFDREYC